MDGDYVLINLDGFKIKESGELVLTDGRAIRAIKHLWNFTFEVCHKVWVKTMVQSLTPKSV